MLSTAAQSDVDVAAIITYTINELPGSNELKAHLYEAGNLDEFERKLRAYEIQFAMTKGEKRHDYVKKDSKKEGKRERGPIWLIVCSHLFPDCPSKNKGPKCFKCNKFGHKSSSCSEPNSVAKPPEKRINMIKKCSRNKTVEVNNVDVDGLADTASDYTVIREDQIETKNISCEKNDCSDSLKGVGGLANFKRQFKAKIDIDNELHDVDCFIMSKEDIDDELIGT